ncbi:hypothetical protein KEM55_001959 [Ascosphaera atra]|nr:hypothetical protein KEM55_001959 [Ascosphaera atra]
MRWGHYISDKLSIPVVNKASPGESARSYTTNGYFSRVANLVKPGDHVVIQFGHNDWGNLELDDDGLTPCAGTGSETFSTVFEGEEEIVLTFPAYLQNAVALSQEKGAHVLVASMRPTNPWLDEKYDNDVPQFVEYTELAAKTSGAEFVDHFAFTSAMYKDLGSKTVNSFYPEDHVHTNPEGAKVVAEAFLKAIVDSKVSLSQFVKDKISKENT